jgi:hypothetical protein
MCSRQFDAEGGDDIWAYFWAPYERDEHEFVCDYLVIGLGTPIALYNIGVDGLDAILGATDQVRRILEDSDLAIAGKLSWWGFNESFGLYDFGRIMPPGQI